MLKLSARTDPNTVERRLHDMYDGEHPVIAVEIFGPASAMVQTSEGQGGPWVLGDRDEVMEYAEGTGWDFEVQYSLEHPGEDD